MDAIAETLRCFDRLFIVTIETDDDRMRLSILSNPETIRSIAQTNLRFSNLPKQRLDVQL